MCINAVPLFMSTTTVLLLLGQAHARDDEENRFGAEFTDTYRRPHAASELLVCSSLWVTCPPKSSVVPSSCALCLLAASACSHGASALPCVIVQTRRHPTTTEQHQGDNETRYKVNQSKSQASVTIKVKRDVDLFFWCEIKARSAPSLNHGLLNTRFIRCCNWNLNAYIMKGRMQNEN